jgi:hypothetical protein
VFSAAAVFHFMLSGRAPFASSAAVLSEPPPALGEAAAPEPLARTLTRALDKSPAHRHHSIRLLGAEIEQVRIGRRGDRDRVLKAALDRYREIESLLDERRTLGRRLGVASIDRDCEQALARLVSTFPEFARAGGDMHAVGPIDPVRAADALAQLQLWHNEVLAAVAVLKTAGGGR